MVLAQVPFAGVTTFTSIEDQVAELTSFALFKVPKVDLLERIKVTTIVYGHEAGSIGLFVNLGTMIDRAIC